MVTANYHQQLRIWLPVGSEYITGPREMATERNGPGFSGIGFGFCTWYLVLCA
jgi:hypothetical protein